ncbi:molybdopterin cofactor-binding domain-containing protein [Agaribacterium sp. ZY112]|uniref:xanthine dehydrogenase family protein molybdopterin-binding subunit n=1 Tax=Agaribacterium sp. ZY112 TaxID=3233574 RepID=UPI00352568AF
MNRIENISRRSLLAGVAKSSLVLSASIPAATMVPRVLAGVNESELLFKPSVYLEIRKDNTVAVICHRSEMGQGVRTSIPMVVADELEADWNQVEVIQAQGDEKYGSQNTDGSSSIRNFYYALREAGATGKQMLEAAAAQLWDVDVKDCKAQNGFVYAGNKKARFGDLAELAATQPVPKKEELSLKEKSDFKFIGNKAIKNVDADVIASGQTVFGIDVELENLHIAFIQRPPVLGATVKKLDSSQALKVPGVVKVIEIPTGQEPLIYKPLGGVAVIATNTWAAMKGREKLKISWSDSPHAVYNSAAYRKQLEADIDIVTETHRTKGDVDTAFANAERQFEQSYYIPDLTHMPMETPAAAAIWHKDGRVEAWAATQNPQAAVDNIVQQLGAKKENVAVNVTLIGGAFGRKSKQDFVVEAALLSKESGLPIKVCWTREDDVKNGYYQACTYQRIRTAIDKDGAISAWRHKDTGPGIRSLFTKGASGIAFESNLGMKDIPFDVPNILSTSGPGPAHVRYGWMRSVSNIGHGFSIGSYVDELARYLGKDTYQFWLEFIGKDRHIDFTKEGADYFNYGSDIALFPYDTQRLKACLSKVASMSAWPQTLPKGQGLGISVHRSFCTNVACAVKVVTKGSKIEVEKVWMAMDAGVVVNPERAAAQLEGSVIFALSLAFYGELTAKDGVIEQSNFDDYEQLRIAQCPEIEVAIIENNDSQAGGVGEPGVPPVAPALCNAIFAATGKRYRELPLKNYDIV